MTRSLLATGFWVAAAAVLIFEGFVWVRFGKWPAYSVIDAVSYLGTPAMAQWARAPVVLSWLQQALAWLPLPATFAILAVALSWRSWRQ